ncbi:rod shape-determining protein MreC [Streptacidiphilus rugosus]|uniref:rod shape-determining protein MreC n=1 Tax=Streptacidiphilus rugosus TaxID=405783 RepID=UPI000567BCF7|nr:rod shape-determining protein MreC [Streptacidiphilus rugosus]
MRDTRESRLLLILLVAVAFALITVDIRGGDDSPMNGPRTAAASVFGPVENGVSGMVKPLADGLHSLRDSGSQGDRIRTLEQQNELLKQQLSSSDLVKGRDTELAKLLGEAGAGQYTIKAAQVTAIGASQNFSWTITIDVGGNDGIQRDMTVINGEGLVGRVTTVAPTSSTVLLAVDPRFTVGTRMEGSGEIGFGTGEGDAPMRVELLNGQAGVKVGDRLVTFGSQNDKPFVPGVPVGTITQIVNTPGELTRTVLVQPFVSFTKLDLVGVVVQPPATDPRYAVLPPKPAPTPTNNPSPSTPPATPSAHVKKKG